ncbi:hypothetical protein HPB50_007227 [Hyalomma asiaticum]|uniref:Uncharacterized protein n=1 Tax=Hyalomma asiaticum TaxID=266040 RepID=A0ACB7SZR2_HYAAI|nr:hypothetical protein HPB50_007227 [Hyalomma asiaticum]
MDVLWARTGAQSFPEPRDPTLKDFLKKFSGKNFDFLNPLFAWSSTAHKELGPMAPHHLCDLTAVGVPRLTTALPAASGGMQYTVEGREIPDKELNDDSWQPLPGLRAQDKRRSEIRHATRNPRDAE